MDRYTNIPHKTVYYKDELNDEFANDCIKTKEITEDYKYLPKNPLWKVFRFLTYRLIMTPIAFLYSKIVLGYTVKNKKVLKKARGKGYFLYVNHTQQIGDAFMPNVALFPKSVYMVVHPNNVSMPVLGRFTKLFGAIPTPTKIKATRNFRNTIEKRILEKACVVIYPEAHIWPYYTDIRPFKDISMSYPCSIKEASFTMTNTYVKRKFLNRPKIISYIDGPFYPDMSLKNHDQIKDLRDRIYKVMKERSLLSDYCYIQYLKEETKNDD